MQEVWPYTSAMWMTLALLAGGYARTRNRSAFIWFVLTILLGPIAVFFLVVMSPAETHEPAEKAPVADKSPAD